MVQTISCVAALTLLASGANAFVPPQGVRVASTSLQASTKNSEERSQGTPNVSSLVATSLILLSGIGGVSGAALADNMPQVSAQSPVLVSVYSPFQGESVGSSTYSDINKKAQNLENDADKFNQEAQKNVEKQSRGAAETVKGAKDAVSNTLGGNPVDAVKGKVSSDINSVKGGSVFGGNAVDQAKSKVSSDIDSVKGKVSSDVNSVKSGLGGNPVDAVKNKVSSDVDSAKNSLGSGVGQAKGAFGGSGFGSNAGDALKGKVSSDVNAAKSAVGGLNVPNPVQDLGNKAKNAADKVTGTDLGNKAKNAGNQAKGVADKAAGTVKAKTGGWHF